MTLQLDKQLGEFFSYLGKQIGLANVWITLSADHGIVPLPDATKKLHMPGGYFSAGPLRQPLEAKLRAKYPGHTGEYVKDIVWPFVYLSEESFRAANVGEAEAEKIVGEALLGNPFVRGYYTKTQLAAGALPADDLGRKYLHSYTPNGGWYAMAVPTPFMTDYAPGVDHLAPYSYDTHVPLVFYGLPFQAGTYRTHAEPVDMAATLASLLGINKPSHAVGRVLTEALASPRSNSDAQEREQH
jgi:arylsulfatase A-like enzyme